MMAFGKNRPGILGLGGILGLSFLSLALLSACGGSPTLVHHYLLEYAPPAVRVPATLPVTLTVESFAVAEAFNSTAMIYQPSANVSDSYRYHRWRVDPGAMVTDCLIRDLRQARLFKAVLRSDSSAETRFSLEGGVEEVQEIDAPETWQAALALSVTLLDLKSPDMTTRVVFQKTFRTTEPLPAKTPAGLAQGMSAAMSRLSQEIAQEVFAAARQRLGSPGKPAPKD